MTMKAALSAGLCAALAITSAVTQAEDEVTTPAPTTGMMEQARTYAQQEGQYKSFGESNQYRNGADNDTGQGTQTRQRNRDGGASGEQHRYGRSSSGGSQYGADNDTGHGTQTRQRSRDGSGSGSQHRYGGSSSGGGRRGGGGRH